MTDKPALGFISDKPRRVVLSEATGGPGEPVIIDTFVKTIPCRDGSNQATVGITLALVPCVNR